MIGRPGLGLLVLMTLGACASEPQYAVRPGAPRAEFEMPKPAYPVRREAEAADGGESTPAPPPAAAAPAPSSPTPSEGSTYYRPQPITEAPPPPDDSPSLRGRASPGPAMAVRSAPAPALETPREVVVRPGESLFEVAERVRTPVRALIDANGLSPPYEVTPGATLKVPPPVIYTVRAGDSLMSVSRRFSIDPRSLANFNDIALETPLKPGQRLAMPALVKDSAAARAPAIVAARPLQAAPPTFRKAEAPPASPRAEPPASADSDTSSPTAATAAGKGRFVWPVKGDILSTFGPKGPGQRNDGINIAAAEGQSVRAAAAGEVVYAGNTIPGFGNLVVIKHSGGWTSLYGNLGKIAVKIRGEVAQGQELGVAGLSGSVDRPQVHFEVRYAPTPQEKARPVDPQGVLP